MVTIPSSNYNVVIGNSITLPCTISASPSVTATSWLFTSNSNTQIQITASNVKYTVSSAGGFYNLTVNSATSSDAGVYECRATNAIDTSTDSARLDVSGSEFLQTSSHPTTPWNILSIFIQYIPQLHNTTNMRFFIFFSLYGGHFCSFSQSFISYILTSCPGVFSLVFPVSHHEFLSPNQQTMCHKNDNYFLKGKKCF